MVGSPLRRVLVVVGGTAAGLVLVLSYRTPPGPTAVAATTTDSPGSLRSAPQGSGGSSAASETVTGSSVSTQYGPVQVQVTAHNGSLTDVQAVVLPSGDPTSARISDYAAPQLRQQALAVQSASLDGVAGASYTSEGFRQSLQSALNQLGVTG
jgi:uncharacterized protein with FMN-binding domain